MMISKCRLFQCSPKKVNVIFKKMKHSHEDRWLTCSKFKVYPWSISGLESVITVHGLDLNVTFDMGYATRPSVKCDNIFISHGHVDHTGAILSHAAKRQLYSMPKATYFVPSNLKETLECTAKCTSTIHRENTDFTKLNIHPISENGSVEIGSWKFVAFPTVHRIPSQGYIAYRKHRYVNEKYESLTPTQVTEALNNDVDIFSYKYIPELAYTGDTTFEVFFKPPNPDLLKVKLLITECTYLDDVIDQKGRNGVDRAILRGHTHLRQFIDNEQLFHKVRQIVFVHLSDKYSYKYIKKRTQELLTPTMKSKVQFGLNMFLFR